MFTLILFLGVLICFGVPVGGMLWIRSRGKGRGKAFFIGMLAFFISQIVIRIPILQLLLPQFAWFSILQTMPWFYGLFLGFTAAVMEEGARWIGMKLWVRGREWEDGAAFGLGHGGIEAVLLVGLNFLVLLFLQVSGSPLPVPVMPGAALAGCLERLFTITFHVGESLLVMYGLRSGRSGLYLGLAVLLHTVTDMAAVVLPAVFGVGLIGMETFIAVFSCLTLIGGCLLYRKGGVKGDKKKMLQSQ